MIITITGKPCSGKGSVSKHICELHNFEYVCTGDMFRQLATKLGYKSILEFQQDTENVVKADKMIDNQIFELGKARINDNIVIDSRLAWHFIPNSFKVFIDIDIDTAALRLVGAKRNSEQTETIEHAKQQLVDRWNSENSRYQMLYKIDNLNMCSYDYIISSKDKSVDEVASEIMNAYLKFMQKA